MTVGFDFCSGSTSWGSATKSGALPSSAGGGGVGVSANVGTDRRAAGGI